MGKKLTVIKVHNSDVFAAASLVFEHLDLGLPSDSERLFRCSLMVKQCMRS
jgi:hypothetical protein